ncbi:Transglutaminase-like superfamily protein [Salegentibacter holothuriorum]|uniref:Transglutaminase-like superfamily protein n=1 Tax=Salegentibacter holothuriorum TaxID=241145 RepID=A0A1T5ALF0_9FLAO|nr:transglutaminase-like domain-containing protein [Salegentibacter holothuriorum]SKB35423.1 Transglutaminase-like superfamily protein [Salegentibacter holothuriorum]
MDNYLKATEILNYNHSSIQLLIKDEEWLKLDVIERVQSIYNFVRDEIKFGYNISDSISATKILEDGYGQCNTKATLLMALLRAVEIPNRIHGFTIDKALQKGAISGIWYTISPKNILHSWVEVFVNDSWYFLEGVILDKEYLKKLQERNKDCKTTFCGYGAYTDKFEDPPIEWNLNHTFIQEKGINQDFGIFETPDDFYAKHQQKLGILKNFVYQKIARHSINKNVQRIREGK